MRKINIKDIDEMKDLGFKIGKNLKGGEIILLRGDLGAGKTHLTKFIGQGMGIDDYITSPTFALLNIYNGQIDLYHFDAYRLEGQVGYDDLGFDEYFYSDGVSIIEWPDIIMDIIPEDHIAINIIKTGKEEERILEIDLNKNFEYILENII